jgi:hypothetical protein
MATVRSICVDALREIGVLGEDEAMTAAQGAFALLRFQNQIDAWAADRLTLSVQSRTAITWPSSTSTQTIGLVGADITDQRPVWINTMTYVNPGSSPAVEVQMGPMDQDSYALQTIKALQSGLPQQFFYQTAIDTLLGSIFIWPQPTQQMTLYLYAPQSVTVPVSLDTVLLGPSGYQDAFMYQLAKRLCRPFGRPVTPDLLKDAQEAWAVMKRPNVEPGLLGVDAALTIGNQAGYNILSDSQSSPGGR